MMKSSSQMCPSIWGPCILKWKIRNNGYHRLYQQGNVKNSKHQNRKSQRPRFNSLKKSWGNWLQQKLSNLSSSDSFNNQNTSRKSKECKQWHLKKRRRFTKWSNRSKVWKKRKRRRRKIQLQRGNRWVTRQRQLMQSQTRLWHLWLILNLTRVPLLPPPRQAKIWQLILTPACPQSRKPQRIPNLSWDRPLTYWLMMRRFWKPIKRMMNSRSNSWRTWRSGSCSTRKTTSTSSWRGWEKNLKRNKMIWWRSMGSRRIKYKK